MLPEELVNTATSSTDSDTDMGTSHTNPSKSPENRLSIPDEGEFESNDTQASQSSYRSTASNSEKYKRRSYKPVEQGLVGLTNLGNTCYMNSALQCLSHTREIMEFFVKDSDYNGEINRNNPMGTGGRLVVSFAGLMKNLWTPDETEYSIAPTRLKRDLAEFAPHLAGYAQQDAQEFLAFLLDGLHEDLNRITKKQYIEEPDLDNDILEKKTLDRLAAEAWQRYLRRNSSHLVDLFQGQLKSELKCQTCSYFSIRFDPVMYLSLPLRNKEGELVGGLQEAFNAYTEEEDLGSENEWMCPRCKCMRQATKKIDVWVLPPILIVHLKRFEFDHHTRRLCKLDSLVDCPTEGLDLASLVKGKYKFPPTYELYAVLNHKGMSISYGHYTAFCKYTNTNCWYQFNDESVSMLSGLSPPVVTHHSYVLFYRRTSHKGNFHLKQSVNSPQDWPFVMRKHSMDQLATGASSSHRLEGSPTMGPVIHEKELWTPPVATAEEDGRRLIEESPQTGGRRHKSPKDRKRQETGDVDRKRSDVQEGCPQVLIKPTATVSIGGREKRLSESKRSDDKTVDRRPEGRGDQRMLEDGNMDMATNSSRSLGNSGRLSTTVPAEGVTKSPATPVIGLSPNVVARRLDSTPSKTSKKSATCLNPAGLRMGVSRGGEARMETDEDDSNRSSSSCRNKVLETRAVKEELANSEKEKIEKTRRLEAALNHPSTSMATSLHHSNISRETREPSQGSSASRLRSERGSDFRPTDLRNGEARVGDGRQGDGRQTDGRNGSGREGTHGGSQGSVTKHKHKQFLCKAGSRESMSPQSDYSPIQYPLAPSVLP
eukprot:Platyproteum_vivax@DN7008_c3_g1_i5.p1